MAFRHVYIEHPVYISIKLKQLNIYSEHDQYTFTIPLEDIESIILDNYKSVITAYALMEITRYKITMVICGSNHLPQGICLPQHQYYKKFTMLNEQFKMSKQVIGRLWRNIVKQKLKNESTTLSILNRPYTSNIEKLIKLVKPNDVNNVEAQAARIYFIALFGQDFQRRDENPLNDVLNYGYAIIRSMISRDLCAYGLEPCLGLHHHNYLNSFNLSDDLIEPFRSYVDLYVFFIICKLLTRV